MSHQQHLEGVVATAVDAMSRKLHTVNRGYFDDPFVEKFCRHQGGDRTYLNSPLMNRGYWLRVRAVESAINRFVEMIDMSSSASVGSKKFQILSLGGGFDTLFYRMQRHAFPEMYEASASNTSNIAMHSDDFVPLPVRVPDERLSIHLNGYRKEPNTSDTAATEKTKNEMQFPSAATKALRDGRLHRFVEVDQPTVITAKRQIILRDTTLGTLVGNARDSNDEPLYRLLSANLADTAETVRVLSTPGGLVHSAVNNPNTDGDIISSVTPSLPLDPSLPTLIIAECVLVYLTAEQSTALLTQLLSTLSGSIGLLTYDAIRPHTRFGAMMVQNLEQAGIGLLGIKDIPDPDAHAARAVAVGFPDKVLPNYGNRCDGQCVNATVRDTAACNHKHRYIHTMDMKQLYATIPTSVSDALQQLEMLDDWDEWCLLMEHYGLVWAFRPPLSSPPDGAASSSAQDAPSLPQCFALLDLFPRQTPEELQRENSAEVVMARAAALRRHAQLSHRHSQQYVQRICEREQIQRRRAGTMTGGRDSPPPW